MCLTSRLEEPVCAGTRLQKGSGWVLSLFRGARSRICLEVLGLELIERLEPKEFVGMAEGGYQHGGTVDQDAVQSLSCDLGENGRRYV